MQGVHGEDRRDDPGAGHGQALQEAPCQQHVDQMKRQVDRVIAERRQPPQLVFQPEAGIHDGPVVPLPLDVGGREPDAPQPGPFVYRRLFDKDQVVPDKTGLERRQVADHYEEGERQGLVAQDAGAADRAKRLRE